MSLGGRAARDRVAGLLGVLVRTLRSVVGLFVLAGSTLAPLPLVGSPTRVAGAATAYANPVSGINLQDPSVVRTSTGYAMLGSFTAAAVAPGASGGSVGVGGAAVHIPVLTSTDLASWTFSHDALPVGRAGAWVDVTRAADVGGPAVLERPSNPAASRYVLYYSAVDRLTQNSCVGAAAASSPAGPFAGSNSPLVCDAAKGAAKTPNVRVHAGGVDLLWVFENGAADDEIFAQPLSADGLSLAAGSTRTKLLTAQSNAVNWERGHFDNPAVVPTAGAPVLTFSANDRGQYTYGVNWATCTTTPTGSLAACTRGQNQGPWLYYQFTGNTIAPGAADFFTDASGAVWMTYTGVTGSSCLPDCARAATPRIDKFCLDTTNGVQPRTTAPSTGGSLTRTSTCATDVVVKAENWLAADAMFKKDPQWRGGDGAQSIAIGGGKTVWLFGDSFIDVAAYSPNASVQWSRTGSHFIRNSVGVQTGTDPAAPSTTFDGYWRGSTTPTDFFTATSPGHFLWSAGGVMIGSRLVMLFGDRDGPGLGTYRFEQFFYVDNPGATAPTSWAMQSAQAPDTMPNFGFLPEPISISLDGLYVYIYYSGGGGPGCTAANGMRAARFLASDIAAGDFSSRDWWDGSGFRPQTSFTACSDVPAVIANMTMINGGAGGNVLKDANGRYMEFAGGAFYGGLFTQSAASPTGPWPGGTNAFVPAESTRTGANTYIWMAHDHLTGVPAGTTWVTWNSNGDTVFNDETLYYPRFAKVVNPS